MSGELHDLLGRLWEDYRRVNPQAERIHALITACGDRIVNDHVAFRTLDHPKLGIDATARVFEALGYRACDEYHFPEKRLYARHYEADDPALPKVFVSELRLGELSRGLRDIVASLLRQVDPDALPRDAFVLGGTPWNPVMRDTYERLRSESEYAAWVAAFGFRANHFTILVNALESFASLADLNAFLKDNGFVLNDAGGEIKGSPADGLEQSSTLAAPCSMRFADGAAEIPGCYYEFAWRHPLPDGRLFPGFVARSAERLFESTDQR